MTDETMQTGDCGCEGTGCLNCDPEHHELTRPKWIADDTETLPDVIKAIEEYAAALREQMNAGWQLEQPVSDGYIWLVKPEAAAMS